MLLAACVYVDEKSGEKRNFRFYGEYEVNAEEKGKFWLPLEIRESTIREVGEDGIEKPFEPNGTTWSGIAVDEDFALADIISRYSRNEKGEFEILYLQEGISGLLDIYRRDVVLTVEGRELPRKIICGPLMFAYELDFVTNKFAYYVYDDMYLMMNTTNGVIISDNYFAEVGYTESREAVCKGEEILLFDANENAQAEWEIRDAESKGDK